MIRRLWRKLYWPGDIHAMALADLEEDGRAETLLYLTSDEVHRVNGDGTERPVAYIRDAQTDVPGLRRLAGSVTTIGVWAQPGTALNDVVMWSEPMFRVLPDATVKMETGKIMHPQGIGRLANLWSNEPEVLVTANRHGVTLWSSRRNEQGNYVQLGHQPAPGGDSGERRGLGWVHPVDLPAGDGRSRKWGRADIDRVARFMDEEQMYLPGTMARMYHNIDPAQDERALWQAYRDNPHVPPDSGYFVMEIIPGAPGVGIYATVSYRAMTKDEQAQWQRKVKAAKKAQEEA